MFLVGLLVCWLFFLVANVSGNTVIFSVALDWKGEKETSYGSQKADVITYLSWDNKVRYCNQHRTTCTFWVSTFQHDLKLSPRMKKVQQLLRFVKRLESGDIVAYLDVDVVITQPLVSIMDRSDIISGLAKLYSSKAVLAMTEDYNHTTAMRASLGPNNRYQTGVIFLKAAKETRIILNEWLKLSKMDQLTANTSMTNTAETVSDASHLLSDQWLFNELHRQSPSLKDNVYALTPRYVYNAFPVFADLFPTGGKLTNKQPTSISQYWSDLKLPQGDEVRGVSQMVHFAGVFGGASIETGKTDPVVQLLSVHGYIERHLSAVRQLAQASLPQRIQQNDTQYAKKDINTHDCVHCTVIPHTQAVGLLERILAYTHNCVQNVFSMDVYSTETSEKIAMNCLHAIKTQSKKLFVDIKQTVDDITSLKRKSNLYTCCM